MIGWGSDVANALSTTGYPKPGAMKIQWFKLRFMPPPNLYGHITLPPLPPGKSEIDVTADYLFELGKAMRAFLAEELGELFIRIYSSIEYYFSVPAFWNDTGRAALRAAIIQAGFLRDENDNRLTFIAEPEAAATFCAEKGLLDLEVQDVVLIIDGGGGTVDLIAYEVVNSTPLTFAKCTAASGDSCG